MFWRLLFIHLFSLLISGKVWSQISVSSEAFAEVIEALTAHENRQLNFGRFSPEAKGGEITVLPDGMRIAEGAVILASGSFGPGSFAVSGAPDASVTIQLPEGPAMLEHETSSRTILVNNWTSDPPAGENAALQSDGSLLVSIGATIYVGTPEENPVGIYKGTYQVTFAYN